MARVLTSPLCSGELCWMQPIYLDYNSTTPVDPLVLEKMLPYFTLNFGNSASSFHSYGWEAKSVQETARKNIAGLLGCEATEIFFTSGATESNNWVLRGVIEKFLASGPVHIISTCVEHSSILEPLKQLESIKGVEVEYLPVNAYGQVSVDAVRTALRPSTKLISVMWVQNELGSLNPIAEIAELGRTKGVLVHSDATQAVGKLPVDLAKIALDLMTFSSHKFYGPKGVGGLFLRRGVDLPSQILGAGIGRAGTSNVPGIVGMSEALKLASAHMLAENDRLAILRSQLIGELESQFSGLRFNTHPSQSLTSTLNLTFKESLPLFFKGLCVSRGSACHSSDHSITPTLAGIGLETGANTLRISLGKSTTSSTVSEAVRLLKMQIDSHNDKLKGARPL